MSLSTALFGPARSSASASSAPGALAAAFAAPLGLLLLLALTACSPPEATATARSAQLRISLPMQAQQLHLPAARTVVDLIVADFVHAPLGRRQPGRSDLSGNPADFLPVAAQQWQVDAATRTARFTLNPRATFHDGTPVRSRDWTFAWQVFRATPGPAQGRLSAVDSVWAMDSLTLAVRWTADGSFGSVMGSLVALPAHQLDSIPVARLAEHALVRYPIGTGPWRIRSDVSTPTALVLERVGKTPAQGVTQIVLEPLTDPLLQQQALQQRLTDVLLPVRATHLDAVRAGGQQLISLPARDYVFVGLNQKHPVLADSSVRQALALITPQQQVLATIFGGDKRLATATDGPWTSGQPGRDGVVVAPAQPIDTVAAARVLTAGGWRRTPAGWRRGTQKLAFRVMVPTSVATRRQIGQLLDAVWRPFGIDLQIEEVEPAVFAERQQSRSFDAGVFTWHVEADASDLDGAWSCESARTRGANVTGWCNPRFDSAQQTARRASDPVARRAAWTEARSVLAATVPALWLYETHTAIALHSRIETTPWAGEAWWQSVDTWRAR